MHHESEHLGRGGTCVCVQCGTRVPHEDGVPCRTQRCPSCSASLLREGSDHHRLSVERLGSR
jgi:NAD-dependent SIR2 family protein deacetylase